MPKRSTIKQVARIAGVSIQTVSRVLNDRPDVSPETRLHIQQIIGELGYRPSALARSLIQRRSHTLGVVSAGLRFDGPSRTLNGITSRADELGYTVLFKEQREFTNTPAELLIQTLLSHQVDGIIWAVPEVGDNRDWVDKGLISLQIPIIFLTMEYRPNLSIVSYDNFQGAKMATEHLLEQGYKHIAHISGPLDWWESRQRKAGWQATLEQAGIEVQESHWIEGNWSATGVETLFPQLLKQYPGMDAVFAANDQMALSVIKSASQAGIDIPTRLGVVGFDGLSETAYYTPSLTTVAQNQYLLGCTAVEQIAQEIEHFHKEGAATPPQSTILQTELLVRHSSTGR